ncbi:OTU domain-containing protein 6B [Purpureocillium lilacinum]|uniref:OTU domain-containing protein 6B n=1 Tax=Purpureocillium lilacinum TaxID=33203 RepID=A0A179GZ59_PURLI|nr:OTU domain-containing protein 6B [Purpureocillium lilacinum]OAQ82738.1 OTU domain-containing protein 6B [Purpureocillium lilacinum]
MEAATAATTAAAAASGETLEQAQARHRRELKDLQGRITNKKKNATKKTRKGVNDECAEMERQTRERHAAELAALTAGVTDGAAEDDDDDKDDAAQGGLEAAAGKLSIGGPTTDDANDDTATIKPPQPQQQQQQQQQQQEGGKKRNRQKERLARRAAEQEAASAAAAAEASTMTDRRALEGTYMKKAFAANDLVEKDIEPDGHCLFSAVADQLSHNAIPVLAASTASTTATPEPAYKTVRRAAAAFMAENADDFAPFLEEDLDAYVARVRDTAEWGGQLELTALARRYGAEIRVIQDGRTERIGEEEGKATGKTLWLAYYRHGYGLGEHYNSLRKKTTP